MPDPGTQIPANYHDLLIAAGRISWNETVAAANASNFTANLKIPVTLDNGSVVYIAADAESF